jgi:hypothetical protein
MKERHTPEQMVKMLREADTQLAAGGSWNESSGGRQNRFVGQ